VTSFKLPSYYGEEIFSDAEIAAFGREPIGNERAKSSNAVKWLKIKVLFNSFTGAANRLMVISNQNEISASVNLTDRGEKKRKKTAARLMRSRREE
jgi:hypothetical protein